jgi:hypothetical protein
LLEVGIDLFGIGLVACLVGLLARLVTLARLFTALLLLNLPAVIQLAVGPDLLLHIGLRTLTPCLLGDSTARNLGGHFSGLAGRGRFSDCRCRRGRLIYSRSGSALDCFSGLPGRCSLGDRCLPGYLPGIRFRSGFHPGGLLDRRRSLDGLPGVRFRSGFHPGGLLDRRRSLDGLPGVRFHPGFRPACRFNPNGFLDCRCGLLDSTLYRGSRLAASFNIHTLFNRHCTGMQGNNQQTARDQGK